MCTLTVSIVIIAILEKDGDMDSFQLSAQHVRKGYSEVRNY